VRVEEITPNTEVYEKHSTRGNRRYGHPLPGIRANAHERMWPLVSPARLLTLLNMTFQNRSAIILHEQIDSDDRTSLPQRRICRGRPDQHDPVQDQHSRLR